MSENGFFLLTWLSLFLPKGEERKWRKIAFVLRKIGNSNNKNEEKL